MDPSAGFVKKAEMMYESEGRSPNSLANSPSAQFDRCMSDNPMTIKNKQRPDITPDEIAEYRCKSFACHLQLCIAKPRAQSQKSKRDIFSGKSVALDYGCQRYQDEFYGCIAKERDYVLKELERGRNKADLLQNLESK